MNTKDQNKLKKLLEIGDKSRQKDLYEFNENLKAEIRAHGHQPYELKKNAPTSEKVKSRETKIMDMDCNKFISFITNVISSISGNAFKVLLIELCFSDFVPPPEHCEEKEIVKAINADPETRFRVPVYIKPLKNNETLKRIEAHVVVNSKLRPRAVRDGDFLLYLLELSFEMVEEKYRTRLSRDFSVISYDMNYEELPIELKQRANPRSSGGYLPSNNYGFGNKDVQPNVKILGSNTSSSMSTVLPIRFFDNNDIKHIRTLMTNSSIYIAWNISVESLATLNPCIYKDLGAICLAKTPFVWGRIHNFFNDIQSSQKGSGAELRDNMRKGFKKAECYYFVRDALLVIKLQLE